MARGFDACCARLIRMIESLIHPCCDLIQRLKHTGESMPALGPLIRMIKAMAPLAMLLLGSAAAHGFALPPLSVSADGRQLLKGGQPFFWLGDTAWDLTVLDPAEVDQYLSNRRAKGFNVIQGPLLHVESPNYAGVNNPQLHQPNPQWFAHVDYIIDRAAAHNLYIAPVLTWGGAAPTLTTQVAFNYGQFIGQRYRDRANIAVFVLAGEFNHYGVYNEIWDALAEGLLDGLAGAPRLITLHPRACCVDGGQSSSYDLHDRPWLSFNMVQSAHYGDCQNNPQHIYYLGTHNWLLMEHDWAMIPAKPTFDGEGGYEDIPTFHPDCPANPNRWPAFGVRRRAYWSVFAGGFGYTYGANGLFQFNQPDRPVKSWAPLYWWFEAMEFPGATHMSHFRRLMQSRPMPGRAGAQALLLTGTTPDTPIHPHAMLGANGAYAMVYVPQVSKTFTVDMDLLSGDTHRMWWFEPSTGIATFIGEFTRAQYAPDGGFEQTTPATGEDWVLVIDDAAAGFGQPGQSNLFTPADVNGDDQVSVDDLIAVILAWGACPPPFAPCLADLNGDGEVDVDDLIAVILNWGA
jgi:hypothetical protein